MRPQRTMRAMAEIICGGPPARRSWRAAQMTRCWALTRWRTPASRSRVERPTAYQQQKDQDLRLCRSPCVAYGATEGHEHADRSGYTAGLAAARTKPWQHEKHEQPQHAHRYAGERRIGDERTSESRRDVASLDRPPHS